MRNFSLAFVTSLLLVMGLSSLPNVSEAALSNQNNPHVLVVPLGSPGTDLVVLAGLPNGHTMEVVSVHVVNTATIAASDTDFASIILHKGTVASPTIVAELDTRAAHENGLVANIPKLLNLVTAAKNIGAGLLISVKYDETDAGTNIALTGAVLIVNYFVK